MTTFEQELRNLINRHSVENASNTPDFILAQYLVSCLVVFTAAVQQRETWYGRTEQEQQAASPRFSMPRPEVYRGGRGGEMTHEKHCPLSLAYEEAGIGAENCQGCKTIRAAVTEEQERCANIAGNIMWRRFGNELDRWSGERQAAATEIAAVIREQP